MGGESGIIKMLGIVAAGVALFMFGYVTSIMHHSEAGMMRTCTCHASALLLSLLSSNPVVVRSSCRDAAHRFNFLAFRLQGSYASAEMRHHGIDISAHPAHNVGLQGGFQPTGSVEQPPTTDSSDKKELTQDEILEELVRGGALDAPVGMTMPQIHTRPAGPFSTDILSDEVCSAGDVGILTSVWRKTMTDGFKKFEDNKWFANWKDPEARIKEGGSCLPGTHVKEGGGGYDPCYDHHENAKGQKNVTLQRWRKPPSGQSKLPSNEARAVRNALLNRVITRKQVSIADQ
jgi:hypothetical protein